VLIGACGSDTTIFFLDYDTHGFALPRRFAAWSEVHGVTLRDLQDQRDLRLLCADTAMPDASLEMIAIPRLALRGRNASTMRDFHHD